jgi:hypothetical protein
MSTSGSVFNDNTKKAAKENAKKNINTYFYIYIHMNRKMINRTVSERELISRNTYRKLCGVEKNGLFEFKTDSVQVNRKARVKSERKAYAYIPNRGKCVQKSCLKAMSVWFFF